MSRTIPRLVGAAVAIAALSSTLACGIVGADNTDACNAIKKEVQDFTAQSVNNIDDPKALGQSYHDLADKIRSEGEKGDGDLKDATQDLGDAYDKLGDTVSNLSTSSNPTIPDSSEVTAAGVKFKNACD
ncbi:hypothetical protein [Cryptosporangium aurantiacum]|uniref:Small secreted protein n=1 Tax=Cryptosporangium aurantiacum TaxID=134849 RepID=A0A1M7N0U3_9ACTN|nr:hypothetical protein [Cryptosporangium aurantiacum]SHM96548.1 hypothetical protein SAMN05443668_102342 [Cryptosporangium aurantiacum]